MAAERKTAIADVEELRAKLRALPEYGSLAETSRRDIEAAFAGVLDTIENSKLIAVIRERVSGFKSSSYPALLGRVTAPARIRHTKSGGGGRTAGLEDGAASF